MPIQESKLSPAMKKKYLPVYEQTKNRTTSSAQIQLKLIKLKQILNKQNLTARTNKNTPSSAGSVISRKNRQAYLQNSNPIKNQYKNSTKNSKSKEKPNSIIQYLHSNLVKSGNQSPDGKNKKKNKKILSYMSQSSEFVELQKRLQKFKPYKNPQTPQVYEKESKCDILGLIQNKIPALEQKNQLIRSLEQVQSTELTSQLFLPHTQSGQLFLLNGQKFSLGNTQALTINQPSELVLSMLPLQSKHFESQALNDRKNISCMSNFSNLSHGYLKPINEQEIWKDHIISRVNKVKNTKLNNQKKTKSKRKIDLNKPMVSYSLLLRRRNDHSNHNKMIETKISDQLKYQNWLKIKNQKNPYYPNNKKSKTMIQETLFKDANTKIVKKSGSKDKSSKRKGSSESLMKKKEKERSLSSCNKSTNEKNHQRKMNQYEFKGVRLTLEEDITESVMSGQKNPKNYHKNFKPGLQNSKSTQLTKNLSSKYLISSLNSNSNKKKHISQPQEFESETIELEKEQAIKEIHRKYEIEQLSLRLRQELKKITSSMKQSSGNSTSKKSSAKNSGRKEINSSKPKDVGLLKNSSSKKKSCKLLGELSTLSVNQELQSKVIELKLSLESSIIKSKSKSKKILQKLKESQEPQNLSLCLESVSPQKQNKNQVQVQNKNEYLEFEDNEVILIEQNQFDDSPENKNYSEQSQRENFLIQDCPSEFDSLQNENVVSETFFQRINDQNQVQSIFTGMKHSESNQFKQEIQKKYETQALKKPKTQVFYDDFEDEFIFSNSSYEKFIKIYSFLLVQLANSDPQMERQKNVRQSLLIKSLSKPLGTSTKDLLKMMAENQRNIEESVKENSEIQENQKESEQGESILLDSDEKVQSEQISECSVQAESEQDEDQGSGYIISPEVYYLLEEKLLEYLENLCQKEESNEFHFKNNLFDELSYLIRETYERIQQKNDQKGQFPQGVIDFYEQYFRPFSLAVFDLTNSILDELRPYGAKGLPPINFYSLQEKEKFIQAISFQKVRSFLGKKLTQQVFSIKLGLIVNNIESKNTSICGKPILKAQEFENQPNYRHHSLKSSEESINQEDLEKNKAQKLAKVIKKYLQKEARLINKELEFEYSYLEDVNFEILYDLWAEIYSQILHQETSLIFDTLYS